MRLHVKWRQGVLGIGIAVSAALALAACSSSPATSSSTTGSTGAGTTAPAGSNPPTSAAPTTTSASTANFNSCSVVTQAAAASALGTSVTPGVLGTATVEGGLACVFYGPSAPSPTTPNTSQTDSVRVVVVKGSNALTWYNDYKANPSVHAQPVSGYGDQAYYDGFASLSVMKGAYYLRVAVAPSGAPPSLTAEESLATAILPNLK
jgi:hypothetical protein